MKDQTRNLINSSSESRQSKDMFCLGRDAEIINHTNYGSTNYNITYSNTVYPIDSTGNGGFCRGGTLLLDGRVFCVNNYSQSKSFVYDPNADTLISCIENPGNRQNPDTSGVLLRDGRVFICPSFSYDGSRVYPRIYDPQTNMITDLPGDYGNGNYNMSLALPDGRVFISAGNTNIFSLVLDIDTNQITTLTIPFPSGSYGCTLLLDGRVCIPKYSQNILYLWNYLDNTYEVVSLPLGSDYLSTMCLLQDGRVYINKYSYSSGAVNLIFDPFTKTTIFTSPVPNAEYFYSSITMPDGNVFLSSGDVAYVYNPTTDTYTLLFSYNGTIGYARATLLADGRLIMPPQYVSSGDSYVTAPFVIIGEKLPQKLPLARVCSPLYNRQ